MSGQMPSCHWHRLMQVHVRLQLLDLPNPDDGGYLRQFPVVHAPERSLFTCFFLRIFTSHDKTTGKLAMHYILCQVDCLSVEVAYRDQYVPTLSATSFKALRVPRELSAWTRRDIDEARSRSAALDA